MESFHAIRSFLAAVRRRLRGRAARLALLYGLAGATLLLLAGPLCAAWLDAERAGDVQRVVVALLLLLIVGGLLVSVVLPRRRFAADPDVARYVGTAAPAVASDLLSAVELERELAPAPAADPLFSRELAVALAESTAARVAALDPVALVPPRGLTRAARAFAAAAAVYLFAAAALPGTLARGWRLLVAPPEATPARVDAVPIPEPLVGDIALTLAYPAYTGRPPLTVPASSGDVVAPRGTLVTITTRALRPAAAARLVFDDPAGGAQLPMKVEAQTLSVAFKVDKPGGYRFLLEPPGGRPLVEAEAHRIDVEPDHAPRVELYAPADELEVSSRKRVELAFSTSDDYGLSEITLVWRGAGGRDEKKPLTPPRPGARTAEGKFMWDLSEVPLPPGARVAYHLEVKDNDDVGGPNVGSSRTFYLRVYSPRERHEEIIARQQAAFEAALALLADRLEAPAADVQRHDQLHDAAQRLVVELGQLAALVKGDKLSPKGLEAELEAMRGRLDKLGREEGALLAEAAAKLARAPDKPIDKRALDRIGDSDKRQIAELEKDVLILDDWIGRQRIEGMLDVADELRQHRERLAQLMEEYKRTGSEQTRAEIERELRAIAELEAELRRKQAQLGGEVADRFLNSDAIDPDQAADCMAKVRELIEKGDLEAADAQLARCNELMAAADQALAQGLRALRGDKFSEEEKAYSELMDEIAQLEADERELAREADDLVERYRKRAAEVARDVTNPQRDKARKTLEKLRKELEATPREGLTPFAQEEYDAVKQRLDDVEEMLAEGDVAEALAMAREAEQGLEMIQADLDDDMADGDPWSDQTDEAVEHLHAAHPLALKLVEELEQATPSPEEVMSPEDRQQMEALRKRQQALRDRARKLAQKAQKKSRELPGSSGETAHGGLEQAGDQMQRSERRFAAGDPSGAREEAEGAADKLAGLRKGMERSSRPTTMGGDGRDPDDEPVRIPGAEEYKPPERFREDILDAKRKGKAPDGYDEQVDRYYDELVK